MLILRKLTKNYTFQVLEGEQPQKSNLNSELFSFSKGTSEPVTGMVGYTCFSCNRLYFTITFVTILKSSSSKKIFEKYKLTSVDKSIIFRGVKHLTVPIKGLIQISKFLLNVYTFICTYVCMKPIFRYDHYATLCELLPCAIPSLCLCMKTWLSGGFNEEIHMYVL